MSRAERIEGELKRHLSRLVAHGELIDTSVYYKMSEKQASERIVRELIKRGRDVSRDELEKISVFGREMQSAAHRMIERIYV
jgi:Trm5-related predicted tRNA methylase